MRLRIVSICAFATFWSSSAPTAEPPAAPSRFVTARAVHRVSHAAHDAVRRGRLDRLRLARHDDGELGARPLLARRRAARGPRSSRPRRRRSRTSARPATCRWRASTQRRPAAAARCLRTSPRRRRSMRSRRTACRAPSAIRLPQTGSASTRASTAASRSKRTAATLSSSGRTTIDAGRQSVMRSAAGFTPSAGTHIQRSELCATCHTLFTTALDDAGEAIGTLPEQVPYQEWLHSDYRDTKSCQSCHMPEVAAETPIASVLGAAAAATSRSTRSSAATRSCSAF